MMNPAPWASQRVLPPPFLQHMHPPEAEGRLMVEEESSLDKSGLATFALTLSRAGSAQSLEE